MPGTRERNAPRSARSLTTSTTKSSDPPLRPQNNGNATGSSENSTIADACSCSCTTGWEGGNCETAPLCTTTNAGNVDCTALTDSNINTARNLWFSDEAAATAEYGHISDW